MSADLPVRPEFAAAEPYGAPQLDVAARLNVNENPWPASLEVRRRMAEEVERVAGVVNRYPDREAMALRADLAAYLSAATGLTPALGAQHIWAANGSNEVMTHVLQAFGGPGRSMMIFAPTYSMYPEYARNTWTDVIVEQRRADFGIDVAAAVGATAEQRPDVVVITNPNNPTGTLLPPDDVAALVAAAPGMVVVDEAYGEFVGEPSASAVHLLAEHPRLVVARTMSKAFAFAGARLGYLAAAPGVVDACRVVRLPYHLSAVTQAVARVALEFAPEMLARVDELAAGRDELVVWLRARGLEVADSASNFVLFGRFADRSAVFAGLLERGVLVRETGPEGWLRVSIGTPEEMALLRHALDEVLPGAARLGETGPSTPQTGEHP